MPVDSSEGIFNNSRKTMVWFNWGRFDDGHKGVKMCKAPFDILHIANTPTNPRTPYLCTVGFDVGGVHQSDSKGYETIMARQGMGWYDGNQFVIEQSEMGDLSDNWRGLHYFDVV